MESSEPTVTPAQAALYNIVTGLNAPIVSLLAAHCPDLDGEVLRCENGHPHLTCVLEVEDEHGVARVLALIGDMEDFGYLIGGIMHRADQVGLGPALTAAVDQGRAEIIEFERDGHAQWGVT
jgi:hypothetical protein